MSAQIPRAERPPASSAQRTGRSELGLLWVLLALAIPLPAIGAGELSVTVKNPKGEAIPDAVISLEPLESSVPLPSVLPPGEIAQHDQEFTSFVTVVQAGTKVVFPNHDTVQHHVYSLSKAKKFALPLYNPGSAESIVFDVPGVVALGCNIHDWMVAYLLVVPTPYFAKTDKQGTARLAAPAGRYHLEIWHPRLTLKLKQDLSLTETGNRPIEFAVDLKPDRRIRRGPEPKPGEYR